MCPFKCIFCVHEGNKQYEFFDLDVFKEYAQRFFDFGVREFELTPTIGEPMLDHQLYNKIEFLDQLGAEKIIYFTNGYHLTDEWLGLLKSTDKVEINLSLYGGSEYEFERRTGIDGYKTVKDNLLRYITWSRESNNSLVIHKRYGDTTESTEIRVLLEAAKKSGIQIWDCSHDTNWHDMLECNSDGNVVKDVCRFALEDNAVFPNGEVTLCGWFDVNKDMIIGDMESQTLDEIYGENSVFSRLIEDQKNGVYEGLCCACTMKNVKRD